MEVSAGRVQFVFDPARIDDQGAAGVDHLHVDRAVAGLLDLAADAAEDAVKRFQNDQAEFAPVGTPFGPNGAYRLTGG